MLKTVGAWEGVAKKMLPDIGDRSRSDPQWRQTCLLEAQSVSCSGIVIDIEHGYILTHSSLLVPLFEARPSIYSQLLRTARLTGNVLNDWPVKVTLEELELSHADGGCSVLSSVNTIVQTRVANKIVAAPSNSFLENDNCNGTALMTYRGSRSVHLITRTAHVHAVWRSDRFAATLARLFPRRDNWTFHEDPQSPASQPPNAPATSHADSADKKRSIDHSEQLTQLLPFFALIKLSDTPAWSFSSSSVVTVPISEHPLSLLGVGKKAFPLLPVGCPLHVIGTPFGNLSPTVFINSISRGVLSNVAGHRHELLLTDARCIPGTEGGAIYLAANGCSSPCGMVVAPLCWRSNEWVGMSIGCLLSEIIDSLQEMLNISIGNRIDHLSLSSGELTQFVGTGNDLHVSRHQLASTDQPEVLRSLIHEPTLWMDNSLSRIVVNSICQFSMERVPVVLVQYKGTWGSGVLIHQQLGIVLSCSHVVRGAKTVEVTIGRKRDIYTGEVIYRTPDGGVYDVAVIKLNQPFLIPDWPATVEPANRIAEGDTVFVVGHAVFGREYEIGPSVTSGVVSKLVTNFDRNVLIQTTCAVHAGASGGPLLDAKSQFIGIVVCNAKDVDSGATYPHVNLAVPADAIWPAITSFINTGCTNKNALNAIHVRQPGIRRLWSIGTSTEAGDSRIETKGAASVLATSETEAFPRHSVAAMRTAKPAVHTAATVAAADTQTTTAVAATAATGAITTAVEATAAFGSAAAKVAQRGLPNDPTFLVFRPIKSKL